ncbi:CocE/NonD family hydrolase [Streptomyces sp. TRM 70351]|uniref:CocE/NonD family hydrolase n=1 Tax=Streptomyces sp. TRM 70351 TaxID=3116552 RepID=UPI002E7B36C4|nr:CocE/NonD family hydrolase [Streptomyces sp. TRM 70351]MEE1929804.1 CocE/NonD family hydrolase [Streptomyces sp. TRM 70351]
MKGTPHSRRGRTTACAVAAALLAGTASAAVPAAHAVPAPSAVHAPAAAPHSPATSRVAADGLPTELRFVDIPGHAGVRLAANVVAPRDDGRRHPAIVLPTSWAMPQVEYLAQARQLAAQGYVVVSYNVRGFWQSGGEIEVGGPADVADASKVIDWTLEHTAADPARVGMAGISYGAGISLLASAFDDRVRAVAAMSGWADLVGSLYSGRTQHTQSTAVLTGLGHLTGRPSDETAAMMRAMLSGDLEHEADLIAWGAERSASSHVDRINANGAAVMLANAWGDSIFPPNQYADFYEKLTGPKRLELRPGDHATAEATGLLGLPNDVWTNTRRWFDHHLRGVANGIDAEPPVRLKPRSDAAYEGYTDWAAVPARTERLVFDDPERIWPNAGSGANGGVAMLSSTLDQFLQLPPTASVPLLPRTRAAVWQTGRYQAGQRIRGTVTLTTTVTSNRSSGTAIAHLYDVGPLGIGKLITHAPATFHDRTPGEPFTLDAELFSTAYDLPAGHRLALVIDGADLLYTDHNSAFQEVEFTDTRLTVPLR